MELKSTTGNRTSVYEQTADGLKMTVYDSIELYNGGETRHINGNLTKNEVQVACFSHSAGNETQITMFPAAASAQSVTYEAVEAMATAAVTELTTPATTTKSK